LTNSRGYVHIVELIPAQAPAIKDAGIGILDCSPGFGDRFLFTVSKANSCRIGCEYIQKHKNHHVDLVTDRFLMLYI